MLLESLRNAETDGELKNGRIGDIVSVMHEADIADVLETIPREERLLVWAELPPQKQSEVLTELSEQVWADLLPQLAEEDTAALLQQLQVDEIASLLRELKPDISARLMRLAKLTDNPQVRASLTFADGTVGALMDFNAVIVRENELLGDLLKRLRTLGELPSHCDKLFVADIRGRLSGVLPLKKLLLGEPHRSAHEVMISENLHFFRPDDDAEKAAGAFERYDLISAPVLDDAHKIAGRLTIDDIVEYMKESRGQELLSSAGVTEEEDLFASLPRRFINRWRWLFINMLAAFVISRVVGLFEPTIANVVALASLMPIVAGMSGNIGNQTATLTVRALALEQINQMNWQRVIRGEIALSAVNGVVWGGMVGVFAWLLYGRLDLALVLVVAMAFCFFAAAVTGFFFPLLMKKMGKDPALGASVVLTSVVDTLGFFVFLGLGALFLL